MIRKFQVLYGYFMIISLFYLFYTLLQFILDIGILAPIYVTLTIIAFLIIRVRPHPENPHYPFSFCVQGFSRQ